MTIKTFRGLLANGASDRIQLHQNDGSMGYRIVKFQVMAPDSSENIESTVKIYKVQQTAITDTIDFSDNTLLGAAIITQSAGSTQYKFHQMVIFDGEIFNQDIYVTLAGGDYSSSINYYIELEQMILDLSESTAASLKDIRNVYSQIAT